jgi:dienelactone hydrolase
MKHGTRGLLGALLLLSTAVAPCGTEDGGDLGGSDAGTGDGGAPAGPVTALFELPPTSEYYALPFPNDLRRKPDGTLDFTGHLEPNAFVGQLMDTFASEFIGFGTNATVYARFSGELQASSLPADAAATVADAASVYLVDVDPDSPERGRKTPLWLKFQAQAGVAIGAHRLAALPYPGFPLRGATTYALVVTNRVRGADGTPVLRDEDFERVIDGEAGDAARAVHAPLLDWLDGSSSADDREDVVSAAVFTTQDPTALMGKLREAVLALPAPAERNVRAVTGGGAVYKTFEGEYDTPIFQDGDPPYLREGGKIRLDAAGRPTVQRMETLRFAVTVPRTEPPPGGWPVVLYAHGTGGDYRSFIDDGTAGRMAAEGVAAISIDQVLHGPRDPTNTGAELTFVNINNAIASRDNVRQSGADDFQLVRLVKGLALADGQLTHTFNAQKIYFMGHSQGGLTGPPFLAYEPDVKAAVLSGAGALIYFALLYKTQPDEVDIPALVANFVRDRPLDEHNNVFALLQMFLEPADPINYAPLLLRDPLPSVGPKHVYQSEGMIDNWAPIQGIEALGVATGLAPVRPLVAEVPGFALRGLQTLSAPVMSNVNGRTGVFLQYTAPAGTDGHYVIFNVADARRQHARFLGSLARTGMAVLEP